MSKPQLVFFKMMGCGHCVHFYQSPTLETSPWSQLVRDTELSSKVDFVLREWGITKNPDGTVENRKLPDEYKFVNYGPYFWLQNGQDSTQGFEFKDAPRTYEGMKKWILEKIQLESKLTTRAAAQPPQARQAPTNIHATGEHKHVPNHMKQILNQRQVPPSVPQVQQQVQQQVQTAPQVQQQVQASPQVQQTQQQRIQAQVATPQQQVQQPQARAPQVQQPQRIVQQPQQSQQPQVQNTEQVQGPILHQNNHSGGLKRMVLKKQEETVPARKFIAKNHRKSK